MITVLETGPIVANQGIYSLQVRKVKIDATDRVGWMAAILIPPGIVKSNSPTVYKLNEYETAKSWGISEMEKINAELDEN